MTRCYCTYFDAAYLPQGLALYESLRRHSGPFELWVLCLDEETGEVLRKLTLPGIRPVPLHSLEAADPALRTVKPDRSRVEYYFTCTPSWIHFVVERQGEGEVVTYLDADLLFYSDPSLLYEELGEGSVMAVPHRFPVRARSREKFGIFNVGFLAFRNNTVSASCLSRWRDQCLEWCYDRVEDGRFGDQKYLDEWPDRLAPHFRVLENPGGGLAPWNWRNYQITVEGGDILVDGERLVFFHFHGLKALGRGVYDVGSGAAGISRIVRQQIYGRYIRALEEVRERYLPDGAPGQSRYGDPRTGRSRLLRYAEAVIRRRLLIRTAARLF
jgi:hypothetical protein